MKRRGPRTLLLLAVAVWVVVRVLQIYVLGRGTGSEPGLFLHYAQQWVAGAHLSFQPEYPPAVLPFLLLPLVVVGASDYARAFALEMACFDLVACVLVVKTAVLRAPGWPRPLLASVLYTLVTAALYPVLYTRFDLVPAVLVLGSLYALRRQELGVSAILLGVAGAVKLWPLALAPLWLAWAWRRGGGRRLLATAGWIAASAVLSTVLPLLPRPGWPALSFLGFHAARGIEIESTWATIALVLARLDLVSAQPEHAFGAFQLAGRVPSLLAALSLPLTLVLALAPQAITIARGFRGGDPDRAFDHAVLGASLGVLIAGKVLSPQFILWLAPMLPLAVEGLAGAGVALAIGGLTTVVYPHLSAALEQRAPGHDGALLALAARNALLVGWYWVAVRRAAARDVMP